MSETSIPHSAETSGANAAFIVHAVNCHADLLAALEKAKGYMLNAAIDIETGTKKSTTLTTLNGGIKMIDEVLAKARAQ